MPLQKVVPGSQAFSDTVDYCFPMFSSFSGCYTLFGRISSLPLERDHFSFLGNTMTKLGRILLKIRLCWTLREDLRSFSESNVLSAGICCSQSGYGEESSLMGSLPYGGLLSSSRPLLWELRAGKQRWISGMAHTSQENPGRDVLGLLCEHATAFLPLHQLQIACCK